VRAFVARPGMADATSQIERGFFSDQQNAAAARAFGSAKTVGGGLRSIAGELQGHRRSSATLPHTPRLSQCSHHARPLWRSHDAIMKLSWPVGATFGRNDNGRGRICIKTAVGARFWPGAETFGCDGLAHHDAARGRSPRRCPGRGALRCPAAAHAAPPSNWQGARRVFTLPLVRARAGASAA
jgi:hypothetical protein